MALSIGLKEILNCNFRTGYADGLPRTFSGNVYFKKHKFPIIGNISMDLYN